MLLHRLEQKNLIHPPKWLTDNTAMLVQMGSSAYAVSSDASDVDVYGFVLPPKHLVFPHLNGVIPGFGTQVQRFDVWTEHHIKDAEKQVEYDFSVYGIVRYFGLCMENNPNMIDSMFVPRRCVLHSTNLGEHVREHRKMFLHKGAWHKFKGYAYSQLSKIKNKANAANPKRAADIARLGYDTKGAYHTVRLLNEVEQIMVEHDLDLERNREQLKSIRRGEWTLEQIENYFTKKESALEEVYAKSTLQHSPDEDRIKALLMECLEMHYGDLSNAVARNPALDALLIDLKAMVSRYGG